MIINTYSSGQAPPNFRHTRKAPEDRVYTYYLPTAQRNRDVPPPARNFEEGIAPGDFAGKRSGKGSADLFLK